MGRIQGENHVRSHRLLGTRRRYPSPRQCPPPQVSRPAPGSTGTPIWPTLRHPTGSTRITAGIPAGATGTVSTGTTDMLTRTATPTIGVGERATNCPRPAELVGRGTWYREATALVAGFSPARWHRLCAEQPKILCGVSNFGLVGGDHQIETILGTKLGELVPNPC